MLAGTETAGISEEGTWDCEVLKLRRWLAEDRLSAVDPVQPRDSPSLSDGSENVAIHVWHILLGMMDAFDPPPADRVNYGITDRQRENIVASFTHMDMRERFQLLTSFLRMIALLITEVADVAEEVVPNITDCEEEEEGDASTMMEKYITVTPKEVAQPSRTGDSNSEKLFANQVEMEIRTLVSSMEMMPRGRTTQIARAVIQRLRGHFHTGSMSDASSLLESAMITFIPEDIMPMDDPHQDHYFMLDMQDRDFVDYWWSLLRRRLREDNETRGNGTETNQDESQGQHDEGH